MIKELIAFFFFYSWNVFPSFPGVSRWGEVVWSQEISYLLVEFALRLCHFSHGWVEMNDVPFLSRSTQSSHGIKVFSACLKSTATGYETSGRMSSKTVNCLSQFEGVLLCRASSCIEVEWEVLLLQANLLQCRLRLKTNKSQQCF